MTRSYSKAADGASCRVFFDRETRHLGGHISSKLLNSHKIASLFFRRGGPPVQIFAYPVSSSRFQVNSHESLAI
jgi:hypothetical protein